MVTFQGKITSQDIKTMYQHSNQLFDLYNFHTIWRLIDLENTEITFADVIHGFKTSDNSQPGAIGDPRINTLFVTNHPMAKLVSNMFEQEQFGKIYVPILPGLGEALLYVQDQIEKL